MPDDENKQTPPQLSSFENFQKIAELSKDNPGLLAALAKVQSRPPGRPKEKIDSHRNYPYYKKSYAERIAPVLDAMMVDGEDRMFRFSKYPSVKAMTLKNLVDQAWLYLRENADPDGRYQALRNRTIVRKEDAGVSIRFRGLTEEEGDPFEADKIAPERITYFVKDVEIFSRMSKKGEHKKWSGLIITELDRTRLAELFEGRSDFAVNIGDTFVEVVNIGDEIDSIEKELLEGAGDDIEEAGP